LPGGIVPFRQFVLKVCSRCDLACDHCYVYEHADQSWHAKPKIISDQTVAVAAGRIADHARRHALGQVRVVLHGGEPLLAGRQRLASICARLREVIEPACQLSLRAHTNGVLLDEAFCDLFAEHRVTVGVSLDGDRGANDRHRRYADGRSSYDQVMAALALLRSDSYRHLFAGLLCTIDVRNDPLATYAALSALRPPRIDFLLPHATWDTPPPAAAPGLTPYADWLIAVYDRWAADPHQVPVRLFEAVIATSRGGRSTTEALGLSPSDLIVIETDGSLEQVDSIKIAYDGAPETGLDVIGHDLDEAARHPAITARQQGLAGLCATCRGCPVVTTCGGGLYAHRYQTGTGFDNPSVYCADLKKVISYIRPTVTGQGTTVPVTTVPERRRHTLPSAHFAALAAGYGDDQAVSHLAAAHLSTTRALLGQVRDRIAGMPAGDAAWEVLTAIDPAVLDTLLAYPYVRAWAVHCLREPREHAGHLSAIAAAAAIRAGLSAELAVPVRDGYLPLPTLGRLRTTGTGAGTVKITTGPDWFSVQAAGRVQHQVKLDNPVPGWQPGRRLHAAGTSVALEDTDPYRDCHQWPAAPRLAADEAIRWQDGYRQARDLISTDYPGYAPGLASGLTTITPLAAGAAGSEVSAAARQAFGAVAAALPESPDTLALLMLHEFQHVKLGALFDLFDLCDRDDTRLFYAPWRDDPRPAQAVLQGAYAHIAVTDFWRVRRDRLVGDDALAAAARFALWLAQTTEAAQTLAASGALTALGQRFADGMLATLHQWHDEPVPPGAAKLARQRAERHRATWEARSG
jgi:uncharacterized protein